MAGFARAALVSVLLAAPAAHAQEDPLFAPVPSSRGLLSLGFVASNSNHRGDRVGTHTGFGGELAYQRNLLLTEEPSMFGALGIGVAGQAEGVDGFSHGRYATSARFSLGMLGTDVGIAYEETDGLHRSTGYLQLAPFLSAGFAWLALRAAFPLGHGPVYGREVGLVFTLRIPLLFDGHAGGRGHHSP